jgi:glycosyltransferase involved in cell wall biosynthesis
VKRKTVAFFGELITGGTPRGALRLFRAMADELARRDDIELVCLGAPAFDSSDPVGCIYEYREGREYLAGLKSEDPPDPSETAKCSESNSISLKIKLVRALQSIVNCKWPDLASKNDAVNSVNTYAGTSSQRQFPETLFSSADRHGSFSNQDVVGRVISLDKIDVLLNFCWFHIPFINPLSGRFRPSSLRVVAWFLDAIPLRIPHWQTGLIPVPEFRMGVQSHLEAADEIVAISRSAAEDIGFFFPHIHKPVHVVPCGVFESDFEPPDEFTCLSEKFGLDAKTPLFTIIGFQEPSKNVSNALRALIDAARITEKEIQVIIIGFGTQLELQNMLGPVSADINGRIRLIFASMVSETMKRTILAHSTALVYPSKWEGFGIPPLEAMAAGTQVVASDISPLRDVCADLAEYCDPYDVRSISAAVMRAMSKSPADRSKYAERAREHARSYTWKSAAAKLHSSLIERPND